ncbi:MAG: helix-turn-helix domain-containing protein [Deltaproteobacteria bacterium]|nr:helix-turn-helix domain-containing protein [Deltaproteobacteria bacterium]MBW1795694.1 helix-turn-helix domain-containing protein [Deltaproteobacteria bacterium]
MKDINQDSRYFSRLMSVEQAAEYLGLSPRTLYNRIAPKAKNPFPVRPKRIGKLVKF